MLSGTRLFTQEAPREESRPQNFSVTLVFPYKSISRVLNGIL